ncbi:L-aspartate oxidase [Diaphorobacter sp.]|uniref:L-aspartate oxidase n=1 Tax=Diaphorobacter sp. TaxID=1934310 RepID=UPI0028AD6C30|nr:L-aspartate oxidase [Diaphorobacter sp.]
MHASNAPRCDVLIIGAGLAGLAAALSLPPQWRISVLSKGPLDECASAWAQGGIAAVLDSADSIESHVQDTLVAGAGLCDEHAVRAIVTQAPAAIEWLRALGVPFDTLPGSDALHLGREGGHQHRRIAHVADHTGQAVHAAVVRAARELDNITFWEGHTALELLASMPPAGARKRCTGALVRSPDGQVTAWCAQHTILATGGLGRLFSHTTNPPCATGDGIAMASRAGCEVKDLEFIQFHPTALRVEGRSVGLITEALRGEGAVLRLPTGERFMPRHDPRCELAPRDVVARAIWREMQSRQLDCVHLDITHQPRAWLETHFPGVMRLCAQHGIDPVTMPIPVAPCAHYACGGVAADVDGRTAQDGLYAIGEVACTGLHGANRLASNSLLECVVMGRNAAALLASQAPAIMLPECDAFLPPYLHGSSAPEPGTCATPLQLLMHSAAGIERNASHLLQAQQRLRIWKHDAERSPEMKNAIITSELIVQAASRRSHSAGTHLRSDPPPG